MFRLHHVLLVSTSLLFVVTGCATKERAFGEPLKLSRAQTVSTKALLADPANYDGQFVRVSGKVDSVCAKKGCWLRLGDGTGEDTVFVKFNCPVDGRLIPMEAVGQSAIVEGTVTVQEITEDTARHYKEDAGASPEEIAKIVGPQKQISMVSPGAAIRGL